MSDRALVRRASAGDREAVGRLFRRHSGRAWKAAYRACGDAGIADEALQEGFVRAMRHLDSYDPQRPFAAWVTVIVANRARTLYSRHSHRREVALDEARTVDIDHLDLVEGRILATDALRSLPEPQRDALVLCGLIGLSSAEAAQLRGVSASTIRSRIAQARERLRTQLDLSCARD